MIGDSGSGGSAAPPDYSAPSELGEDEGQVRILAWPGYVEDGSTAKSADWVTPFEKETGCDVNAHDVRHVGRVVQADGERAVRHRVGVG